MCDTVTDKVLGFRAVVLQVAIRNNSHLTVCMCNFRCDSCLFVRVDLLGHLGMAFLMFLLRIAAAATAFTSLTGVAAIGGVVYMYRKSTESMIGHAKGDQLRYAFLSHDGPAVVDLRRATDAEKHEWFKLMQLKVKAPIVEEIHTGVYRVGYVPFSQQFDGFHLFTEDCSSETFVPSK